MANDDRDSFYHRIHGIAYFPIHIEYLLYVEKQKAYDQDFAETSHGSYFDRIDFFYHILCD